MVRYKNVAKGCCQQCVIVIQLIFRFEDSTAEQVLSNCVRYEC